MPDVLQKRCRWKCLWKWVKPSFRAPSRPIPTRLNHFPCNFLFHFKYLVSLKKCFTLFKHKKTFYNNFVSTEANCELKSAAIKSTPFKTCAVWGNGRIKQYDDTVFQVTFLLWFLTVDFHICFLFHFHFYYLHFM